MRAMRTRLALRFFFPIAICTLLYPSTVSAQFSRRLNRCLPYSTFAQETSGFHDQVLARIGVERPVKIIIEEVTFNDAIHLSDSARSKLLVELKQLPLDTSY